MTKSEPDRTCSSLRELLPTHAVAELSLAAVALLALSLVGTRGTSDVDFWLRWCRLLRSEGLIAGFSAIRDYPPLSITLLWLADRIAWVSGESVIRVIKYLLLASLYSSSYVFWRIARRHLGREATCYATAGFMAAMMLGSAGLCYLDILLAPSLMLGLAALRRGRNQVAALWLGTSALVKWQPLIMFPFLATYVIRLCPAKRVHSCLRLGLPLAALFLVFWLFFGAAFHGALLRNLRAPQYLSGNALNFNWLLTYALHRLDPDTFGAIHDGTNVALHLQRGARWIARIPRALFWLSYVGVLGLSLRSARTFEDWIKFTLIGYLAYVTFNVGVHENHLAAVIPLAAVASIWDRDLRAYAAFLALFLNGNMLLFYGIDGDAVPFSRVVAGVDTSLLLAALWTTHFVVLLHALIRTSLPRVNAGAAGETPKPVEHAAA